MAPVDELVLMDLDRSNKGASKQRRDQINAEINILRDLLPLPESSRQRLSQLQVMSLSCVYIRKCNILQKLFRSQPQEPHLPDSLDFFQAMTGFLLVATREGKLIYISENVTDYLGHSMVDMKTQGDSLYDIVDKRDHGTVQAKLLQGGSANSTPDAKDIGEDVSFFCRMNMSRTLKRQSGFGDVKVMHVQGHFVAVSNPDSSSACVNDKQYVFMATCSPLITPDLKENLVLNNTNVFKTVHQLDMSFMEVTKMAEHHLGYTSDELTKTSWYSMIHPEDIHEAKEKHMQLVRSNHHEIGCMMTLRMIKADSSIFWVNVVMHVKQTLLSQSDEPYIVCINQIISPQEAYQIKVQGQMFSMYPGRVQELWGSHMPTISPAENFNVNQWIQQEGNSSVPMPSYQCPLPNYPSQSRYQVVYPGSSSSMTDNVERGRPSGHGSSATQYGLPNLVQTDKLKAMLKRKIQGPSTTVTQSQCRPVKVAKMSWEMDASKSERRVYQEIGSPSLVVPDQYQAGETTGHAMEPHQGQVVQVMMATMPGHPPVCLSKKLYKCPLEMTPDEFSSVPSRKVKVEQVVPDINVPESYLTPDPSPISSPEPTHVKTEVMDPDEHGPSGTSAVSILQALEKLASQPQQGVFNQIPAPNAVKKANLERKPSNKGLPIFDAFDIENFFDMLDIPVEDSKASIKLEDNLKLTKSCIKVEQSSPQTCCRPKGDFQIPVLKKEVMLNLTPQQSFDDNSIPFLPTTVMEGSQLSMEMADTELTPFQTANRKDLVVSSIMVQSPKSVGSQETMTRAESLDDLLSCFSDESLDQASFQADCNNVSDVKAPGHRFPVSDPRDVKTMASPNSVCRMPAYLTDQRSMEELSPQSTSSCMSKEDEMMDNSLWGFGMELDSLEANDHHRSNHHRLASPKHQDVRTAQDGFGVDDVFDQMEILLDSLVPSQGSL